MARASKAARAETKVQLPKRMLSREICIESVRAGPGYIYLNNAEAGCATIKQALWRQITGSSEAPAAPALHGYPSVWDPIERVGDPTRRFRFSFVANPYARALSCYREKIRKPGHVRARFLAQYRFPREAEPDFETFLAAICDTDPIDDDQHWRLQAANLLVTAVDLDWVGRWERLESDFASIAGDLLLPSVIERREPAACNSQALDEAFSPEARRLVEKKYDADFQLFGYLTDPARCSDAAAAGPLRVSQPVGRALFAAILSGAANDFQAVTRMPEGDVPEARLGQILATEPSEARSKLIAEALAKWPNDEALLRLSLEGTAGPRAWYVVNRLCEIAPHRAANWLRLGHLQRAQADPQGALESYQTALFLQPRSKAALEAAAEVAAALGRPRLAEGFRVQFAT